MRPLEVDNDRILCLIAVNIFIMSKNVHCLLLGMSSLFLFLIWYVIYY